MPSCELPENPDLGHLRNQAKSLQRAVRAGETEALALVADFHPRLGTDAGKGGDLTDFSRADAQLVVARRYGLASWSALCQHMARVAEHSRRPHREPAANSPDGPPSAVDEFLRLACLTYGDDDEGRRARARAMLEAEPGLATANIHTMAAVGDVAAAEALLNEDPSQVTRPGGPHDWEPLLYATYSRIDSPSPEHSTLELARLLLAHGADPNAGYLWNGLYPFTALTGAFGEGESGPIRQPRHRDSVALARLLLDAGADPNDSQALYNRQFGTDDGHLALLFEYGLGTGSGGPWHERFAANHPSPDELMRDQLEWAAEHDLPGRVRLMLDNGVDPDARAAPPGATGTAYATALRAGSAEIAQMLLAAGADPVALDPVQALRAMLMAGDRAGVEPIAGAEPALLERLIALEPDLVIRATELSRIEAVRLMVEVGFDVNVRRRVTALHEAAGAGDLVMVQALLEIGADPTIRDAEHGSTPLGWAEYGEQVEVVAWLAGHQR